MAYFPIFTQIDGKRCLIAGGGKVAARKVYTLLQYGADVVVMAEKVCGEIKEVLPEGSVFEGVFKYINRLLKYVDGNIFIKTDVIKMNGI